LHGRCDQFRIATCDAGYIASPEFPKDLKLEWNKVSAQAFWGSRLEYHGEFELVLGIARELSKESLGKQEGADCNGWD
jgi:hypothetical protein